MGMAPTDVDRQSLWQFTAAWNGYVEANSPDDGRLSDCQVEELFNWIDTGPTKREVRLPTFDWSGSVQIEPYWDKPTIH